MKKAIGQTVRDLKREVNKKVLKVPSIEQKVLDATSNEPWGPHGSVLADIAQATRNYHEYQMIMSVIWKRTNDTGKNWRHVYKALTVLEYLVAHGSERVIDDIREHAYQISTLSDFQYIDSSGKDQGNNVRKKSQSLVVLVNDKERIQEIRQKAAANREKYRNTPAGSMYRPGSGGYGDRYDDDRYESRSVNRDDDRNGYGRERDPRDDDRYGRYGESYGREADRTSRDNEERYGRDGYKDDEYRGRGQSVDDYQYGSRSRSADRERSQANEDDGQYSSRGSGAKADDHSLDGSSTGKSLDRKYSGQSFGAPPTYEDAVGATRSPSYSERDGESSLAYAPKASSPVGASPTAATTAAVPPLAPASPPASAQPTVEHSSNEFEGFDEFDPRGSFSAAPTPNVLAPATSAVEMDLLGSLSESFSSNSLALVPASQPVTTPEANVSANFNMGPTAVAASSAPTINSQPFDDPFGDGPFQAVPSTDSVPIQQQITAPTNSFNAHSNQSLDVPQQGPQNSATEFGAGFYDATYMPSGPSTVPPPTNTQFLQQESSIPNQNHDIDILADILPPSAPSSFPNAQSGYPIPSNQSAPQSTFPPSQAGFHAQPGQPALQTSYALQSAESVSQTGFAPQTRTPTYPVQAGQASQMGFSSQSGSAQPNFPNPNFYGTYNQQSVSTAPATPYMVPPSSTGPTTQHNNLSQPSSAVATASSQSSLITPISINQSSAGSSSAIVPQLPKDKFETKSTVWADTLSRGLVNLNISGSKTNPLADIGVDFDAINRREKRMEKPTTAAVTSTITMGKAMGSGSGIGRAGAGILRGPPNPIVGSGMSIGMNGGPGPGPGMNMGGYGVSQPTGRGMGMGMGMGMPVNNMGMGMGMNMPSNNMGMGMGMGMNMPSNNMGMGGMGGMGMGMNMGMGQGMHMQQQQMGVPPGSTTPGGYNYIPGAGNYGQQPYGGGYR